MRESFLLGGQAIRQLVLDPLLPEPIVAVAPRQALVAAVGDYDRVGRGVWAGWLGDGDTAPETLPADVRGLEAASQVWRAAS